MIMASTRIENVELELVGVDRVQQRAEERARDAAERGAGGVGQQLGLDRRDAHRHRGDLVLAQRDPRAAQPRVAQAEVHEQHDHHQEQGEPVPRSQVQAAVNGSRNGRSIRSTGEMP